MITRFSVPDFRKTWRVSQWLKQRKQKMRVKI
jgi:hypothetical protein